MSIENPKKHLEFWKPVLYFVSLFGPVALTCTLVQYILWVTDTIEKINMNMSLGLFLVVDTFLIADILVWTNIIEVHWIFWAIQVPWFILWLMSKAYEEE